MPRIAPLCIVLLVGFVVGGCDVPVSSVTEFSDPNSKTDDYTIEAYAKDASTILEGTEDRVSSLSPKEISSLRSSARELRKALKNEDLETISEAQSKVQEFLRSKVFPDDELVRIR